MHRSRVGRRVLKTLSPVKWSQTLVKAVVRSNWIQYVIRQKVVRMYLRKVFCVLGWRLKQAAVSSQCMTNLK